MPDIFTPSDEQKEIVRTPGSALVIAGPGTGKTRTAIEKALYTVSALARTSRQQVIFLSFSNAAVRRLADSANVHIPRPSRSKLRFATYHALAAELLRKYGRFGGLPPRTRIVDKLDETLFSLEENWPLDEAYGSTLRDVARTRGLLTFDVLVPLATRILATSPQLARILARRFPLIIVDEFQDTSMEQWELLKAVGAYSDVTAFGDPNQIIYASRHQATAARMQEFQKWKGIETAKFSARNFRCGSVAILEFAEALLHGRPFVWSTTDVQFKELRYRAQLRAFLATFWRAVRDKIGPNETIGFLAPSNAISEDIAIALRAPPPGTPVAFPVYAKMARDPAAHDAVLLALAALRDYCLTPSSQRLRVAAVALLAMDLHWNHRKKRNAKKIRNVESLVEKQLQQASALADVAQRAISAPQLAGLAPNFITALAEHAEFRTSCKRMGAYDRLTLPQVAADGAQLSLFDQIRSSRDPKGLTGYTADSGTTHVLNYHRAKGREFDFVAIVVDPRGESNKTAIEEARRLYYVCATRARKHLHVIYYRNQLGRVLGPVLKPAV